MYERTNESTDPSGLHVNHPAFFQSSELFFSPILFLRILRTFFRSEPLILLTLRPWGEVYLPPPPSLASAKLPSFGVGRLLRRICVLSCLILGTNFGPIKMIKSSFFFQRSSKVSKFRPDPPKVILVVS